MNNVFEWSQPIIGCNDWTKLNGLNFDPSLERRRVSDEAYMVVSKVGCIFLQFPTFTYLRVGCYTGCPYMLPRYPSDKWVLMEMCRQLISVRKE